MHVDQCADRVTLLPQCFGSAAHGVARRDGNKKLWPRHPRWTCSRFRISSTAKTDYYLASQERCRCSRSSPALGPQDEKIKNRSCRNQAADSQGCCRPVPTRRNRGNRPAGFVPKVCAPSKVAPLNGSANGPRPYRCGTCIPPPRFPRTYALTSSATPRSR
jgi:hypothetical protein